MRPPGPGAATTPRDGFEDLVVVLVVVVVVVALGSDDDEVAAAGVAIGWLAARREKH